MQTKELQIKHSTERFVITCKGCNKYFTVPLWRYKQNPKYCSYKCYWENKHDLPWITGKKGYIKANKTSFKNNGQTFTGTISEYKKLHYRISKYFGKPDTCEKCLKSGLTGKNIHWANISGKYLEVREDWKRLCVRCHFYNDYKIHVGIEYGNNTL